MLAGRAAECGRQPAHVGIDADIDVGGLLELHNRVERHVAADLQAVLAPIDAVLGRGVELGRRVGRGLRQAGEGAAAKSRPLAVGLLQQIVEVIWQTTDRGWLDLRHGLRRVPRFWRRGNASLLRRYRREMRWAFGAWARRWALWTMHGSGRPPERRLDDDDRRLEAAAVVRTQTRKRTHSHGRS